MKKRFIMVGLLCFMLLYQGFYELMIFYETKSRNNEETNSPISIFYMNSTTYNNETYGDLISTRWITNYSYSDLNRSKSFQKNYIPLGKGNEELDDEECFK